MQRIDLVSASARGRNIRERRQSSSRSSSSDSVAAQPLELRYRRSRSDSSDEEVNTSSRALTGGTSELRPSTGFQWGHNQAQSGSRFGGSSAFSQFTSNRANSNGAQPAPFSAYGAYAATSLVLPSKVYRGDNDFGGALAATQNRSSPASYIDGSLTLPSALEVATPSPAVESGDNTIMSARCTTPQAFVGTSSVPETKNPEHQGLSANAIQTCDSSPDALPTVQDSVSTDQPYTVTQQAQSFSADFPPDGGYSTDNAGLSILTSVPGLGFDMVPQNATYSIHDFMFTTSAPVGPTGAASANAQGPSFPGSPHTDESSSSTLPPAHQMKVSDSSTTTGQTSVDNTDTVMESTKSPQAEARPAKKRRMRKDADRKRGDWRVHTYPASSSGSHHERPFSTLPGKPLFSASAPVSSEPTPLPHFEYKESRERIKLTSSNHDAQDIPTPTSNVPPTNNAHGSTNQSTFESVFEGLDTACSFETDTDAPAYTDGCRLPAQDGAPDDLRFPSDSSQGGEPPGLGLSPGPSQSSMGDLSSQGSVGGRMSTVSSARLEDAVSYGSAALLDERAFASSNNRVVSIVIEDNRIQRVEPSFVELILPLRPDGSGAFWLDAIDLCNALQSGPSRIDGPAKVYAFRGRFRQYFLRVSAGNIDNFAPANLSVTANRFLRVVVESALSSTNLPPVESSSELRLPRSPIGVTYLASPALSEEHSLVVSTPTSRSLQPLKRRRDQSPVNAPRSTATSGVSVSGPAAKGKEPGTSDPTTPRPSYYRKRAL